ncbi:hypothetical protein HYFRA_00011348 [Hymenoscyphus fraxineus]|uniref:F-box domain-containing protein n=1 Tax=Hymenoscyphus fraxineus TaxID=746836 RepID=A0A9N9KWW1_9HELO|nr:hypothetical protein HYFRA_00011348 [Hymenoscyphus fraxineus]
MAADTKSIFLSLPAEIHREILDHLEEIPAVLLSLTCKQMRETYKLQFPTKAVDLTAQINLLCGHCQEVARYRLHEFLVDWIPSDVKYDAKKKLYVSKLWTKRARLQLGRLKERIVGEFKGVKAR